MNRQRRQPSAIWLNFPTCFSLFAFICRENFNCSLHFLNHIIFWNFEKFPTFCLNCKCFVLKLELVTSKWVKQKLFYRTKHLNRRSRLLNINWVSKSSLNLWCPHFINYLFTLSLPYHITYQHFPLA